MLMENGNMNRKKTFKRCYIADVCDVCTSRRGFNATSSSNLLILCFILVKDRSTMNKTLWLFVVFAVTIQSGQSGLFLPRGRFYFPLSTTYMIQRGKYNLTYRCDTIVFEDGKVTPMNCVWKGIRINYPKVSQIIRM